METTKHCCRCDRTIPLSEFNISSRDKVQGYCRECQSEYSRKYNIDHRDIKWNAMLRADRRLRYRNDETFRETIKARNRKWYAEHRSKEALQSSKTEQSE